MKKNRFKQKILKNGTGTQHNNIYIFICMYIYILLGSIMGCFFWPNAFENAPTHAFENGVRNVNKREIPIFTMFRGFRDRNIYYNHSRYVENEASSKKILDCDF